MAKKKIAKKKETVEEEKREGAITVTRPNQLEVRLKIRGDSPYCQRKFGDKAKAQIRAKMVVGGQAKKSTKREPKDFDLAYEEARYKPDGESWPNGAIPATQFKAAMVSACRLIDFKMTDAKQCFYIEADGYDGGDMTPLVRVTKGKPVPFEKAMSLPAGGTDIAVRPLWQPGWECVLRIKYDADRFTADDIGNLLMRAGCQVGIGEGRQASRKSVGVGWGSFEILNAS